MLRGCGLIAAAMLLPGCIANPVVDESKVRTATEDHFGSELVPMEIGPVVLSGDHALADWTQGDYGGRAVFERNGGGWMLLLCSGDSIRRPENLIRAGVPAFNAGQIADGLARAEAALPAQRLGRMKRFVGTAADHQKYLRSLESGEVLTSAESAR